MSEKTCRKCGESKPLPSFNRDKRLSDGRRNECRDCTRARSAEWRQSSRDHLAAYYKADAQRRKAYQREWRAANPERVRAYRQTSKERAGGNDYLTQWRRTNGLRTGQTTQESPVQAR